MTFKCYENIYSMTKKNTWVQNRMGNISAVSLTLIPLVINMFTKETLLFDGGMPYPIFIL